MLATAFDDFMNALGNHRDYVLLALAVLVLTEGAIIVLWARRATRLRFRMEDAVATAERSAAAAKAAAASASEQSQGIYRVAERLRDSDAPQAAAARPERRSHTPGRTILSPTASAAQTAVDAVPATAAAPAATSDEYVTPVAQKAAEWVLPAGEPTSAGDAAPPAADVIPLRPRPDSAHAPDSASAESADNAPTTLGWSGTQVPVEPAADFAVLSDADTLRDFAPPPAPATPAAPAPVAAGNGSAGAAPAVSWADAGGSESAAGWDAAMFDSNTGTALDDESTDGGDILLVEDDPAITKLYSVLLESRGYTVRHAEDGLEGLDRANQRRPDLVLLDIMMPRMNGIAFLQALRSGPMKDVPVVVLSNFMEKQLVADAMSLGALEYMVKAQTRPEALVGALPHWLRGERAFTF